MPVKDFGVMEFMRLRRKEQVACRLLESGSGKRGALVPLIFAV
jgi:hypothetical protein